MEHPVIIIGAGLSGLRAATLLTAQGIDCKILDSRSRIGGRALSSLNPDEPELGKFDLGPTWFWPRYERTIAKLVQELHLETFDQHTEGAMLFERYDNQAPERHILPAHSLERSVRFTGGVQSLIDALARKLPSNLFELETRVTTIKLNDQRSIIISADLADGKTKDFMARAVILALPPRLVARDMTFIPTFSPEMNLNLTNKPTWMAGQAKAIVVYDDPFWRKDGLSGFASSWVGPLQEIHDASPHTGSGALFGFFGMLPKDRQQLGEKQVLEQVKEQLIRLFGSQAKKVRTILYKDWSVDLDTAISEDSIQLQNFPNYGEIPVVGEWENKIVFAGTETNSEFGGHLEGALQSAELAVSTIVNR
ncbi:NAD(P)-binding protein [Paenibacillus taichungensis]|uniref:NAD(P)-binding protein n=1 Tax=Paenibacillus taichungensis TaxID=484184 RepID=A0ABX2MSF7_9BACL|nr:FAD-dependent oxidoreductase [Paenibacillus taichungensis]NUU56931.1 NAD(P)-binding protein [Paenibacillus taichungensis]